ncbi:hypothetical protein L0Y65_01420 [Candidatus Micrarchaeota archaeon]|nr:hypothetical protein [Candidatus Micrarchaeota archaeon]
MTYTIRNVDARTKEALGRYASANGITAGEAMRQLVEFGLEYCRRQGKIRKKYSGARDALEALPKW